MKKYSYKQAWQECKKNNLLKTRSSYFFTDSDIDTFKRMVTICIKFRISDEISINKMLAIWKKMKELN